MRFPDMSSAQFRPLGGAGRRHRLFAILAQRSTRIILLTGVMVLACLGLIVDDTFSLLRPAWTAPRHAATCAAPSSSAPASGPVSPLPKIHLITVATEAKLGFCRLAKTAFANGWDLTVLKYKGSNSVGKMVKVMAVADWLAGNKDTLPDDEIVLMVDGFDVHIQRSPQEVVADFVALDTPVLYSAEKTCWPYIERPKDVMTEKCNRAPQSTLSADIYGPKTDTKAVIHNTYGRKTTRPRWLNSGLMMGRVGHLRKLYESMAEDVLSGVRDLNDQEMAADRHLEGTYGIALDYASRLFLSADRSLDDMVLMLNDAVPGGKPLMTNKVTGTVPAFLHYNGEGKPVQDTWYPFLWSSQGRHACNVDASAGFTTDQGKVLFADACGEYLRRGRV
ncbi:Multifunctional procollagen lysine hydroxylase and glycosyltransferase LH3 [Thoreauomyces humboldtii]|nr:Multifunctional procollagen lysine hydroxylase and glycosyltransferase LH3 [Thoreauomyces humboldtii]